MDKNRVSVLVRTEEQLKWVLDKDVRIYTEDFNLYKNIKIMIFIISFRELCISFQSLKMNGYS